MRARFIASIEENQKTFDLVISGASVERLADYYELVLAENAILHLVAPCSPEEFATRHILESLMLLKHLPQGVRFADVGSGAGLPSIPCLIVREDLSALIIESRVRKASFLKRTALSLGIQGRSEIVGRQFEEVDPGDADFIACRALDRFTDKLPRLIKWSGKRDLLFFSGPGLSPEIRKYRPTIGSILMPLSERRFLFTTATGTLDARTT